MRRLWGYRVDGNCRVAQRLEGKGFVTIAPMPGMEGEAPVWDWGRASPAAMRMAVTTLWFLGGLQTENALMLASAFLKQVVMSLPYDLWEIDAGMVEAWIGEQVIDLTIRALELEDAEHED